MANHKSLGDFGRWAQATAAKVEPAAAALIRESVLAFVEDVAKSTPIKTGQAQSNWLVSIDSAAPYYIANASGNNGWQDAVDFAKQALAGLKVDSEVHITNNVPYIVKLNSGTSTQAPALFVQLAVTRAQYRLRGVSIKLN